MAWSTLTNDQFISFQDGLDCPFNKHYNIAGSNKFMTKAEVLYYLDIVESNLDSLIASQWVPKSLLSSATIYNSAVYSESATRNNCGVESNPTTVTLSSTYGQFTSTVSQAAADSQAVTWVQANKQTYANTNGQCILRNTAWRGINPYCEQVAEVRPYPMINVILWNRLDRGQDPTIYFTNTLENAIQAYYDYLSNAYILGGNTYQMISVAVGNRCYYGTSSSLLGPSDGYYLTDLDLKIYHFVSSILTEIINIQLGSRPTGLTNAYLAYKIINNSIQPPITTDFSTNFYNADDAVQTWVLGNHELLSFSTHTAQASSYVVGNTVYFGLGTDDVFVADGYYILTYTGNMSDVTSNNSYVHHIVSGIITEIIPIYY